MKKTIFVCVLLAALGYGNIAAQDFSLSIGGGGVFDYDFGQGVKAEIPLLAAQVEVTQTVPWFGGFIFFDATYAEANLTILYGSADIQSNNVAVLIPFKKSVLAVEFGLLGKFPVALGEAVTIFPLLGANYNMILFASPYNTLGFQAGAGIDYALSNRLSLRAEALFNFRFANQVYTDLKSNALLSDASAGFGLGPRIKIGAGYTF
jgi:opacity protein-like surface antigen